MAEVLPRPDNDRERRVLAAVFELLQQTNRWPTFGVLDRHLDMVGEPAAEDLLLSMPTGLVYGVAPGSSPIRDDQEIELSVAALAMLDSAHEDVDLFLQLVGLAAALESEQLPHETPPQLTPDVAAQRLTLPAAGRKDLLTRAGAVLAAEPWGWSSHAAQADGGEWSFTIDRRVRRFRTIESLEGYWEVAHPHFNERPFVSPPISPLRQTIHDSGNWLQLLHPEIRAIAGTRLAAGHADNAVEEAWKAVAQRLRELAELDLDGVDLVNQALGNKGSLRLGKASSPQGRNEHDGITNLLRGFAQIGRNVRAHRPSKEEIAGTEIAALLLVASMCLDRLDGLADETGSNG